MSHQSQPGKREQTVLVLHRQPELLNRYRALLEQEGFKVTGGVNGSEAVAALYNNRPALVVADVQLPQINGYQVCRLVKHDPALKTTPVILVSDSEDEEKMDRFWGFKAGADDFLRQEEIGEGLGQHARQLLAAREAPEPDASGAPAPLDVVSDMINVKTRLTQILDKSLIETTVMIEFRNLSDLIHDRNLLSYTLFNLMESLVAYDLAALFFNDRNREPRLVTFHLPESAPGKRESLSLQAVKQMRADFFSRVSRREAVSRQFDVLESDTLGEIREDAPPPRYSICYFQEFFIDNDLIGAFAFYARQEKDYSRTFPVQLIENELKLLMKLRYLYSQAETLAITDGLTGLFNYRHFMLTIDREFRRARRYGLNLSLALIDLDHFKDFNDQWGHMLGDEVLRSIADQAGQSFRGIDFVSRYGGEELAVILPETSLEKAAVACERFRESVQESFVHWEGEKLTSTVSIGLASLSDDMESASELIRRTDQLLYEAKKQGRNRLVTG